MIVVNMDQLLHIVNRLQTILTPQNILDFIFFNLDCFVEPNITEKIREVVLRGLSLYVMTLQSSANGHLVEALALRGDEGRSTLR